MAGTDWGGGMNINLHIERLVFDGVSLEPQQRVELKAAVISELGHLLAVEEGGLGMASGSATHAIRGDAISVDSNGEILSLGQQIAGAVYGGIRR